MGFSPDLFFFFNKESQSYNFKPSELLYHICIVKKTDNYKDTYYDTLKGLCVMFKT